MTQNTSKKGRFCEICARAKAVDEGWLAQLAQQWGDEGEAFSDAMRAALEEVPLDEILLELFEAEGAELQSTNEVDFGAQPFLQGVFGDKFDDENLPESISEVSPFESEIELQPRENLQRCSNCLTSWDTLKSDGRAGCSACYEAFRTQLGEVVARVQRGENHLGKLPRAAQKRASLSKNLHKRRENQLQLLKNRLEVAVASEKYEEAAKLRDKINAMTE